MLETLMRILHKKQITLNDLLQKPSLEPTFPFLRTEKTFQLTKLLSGKKYKTLEKYLKIFLQSSLVNLIL